MSIIQFPVGLSVSRQTWGQQRNDIEFRSMFGAQALEGSGPLWAVDMTAGIKTAGVGTWQALLLQLRGKTNQLAVWNMGRPAPLGTMRGAMTLATTAQGATTMTIATAYGENLATFPEDFSNAAWTKSAGGTGVAAVVTPNAAASPDGLFTADRIVFDKGAGTTSTDQSQVTNGTTLTITGQPTAAYVLIRSATASSYTMRLDFSGVSSEGAAYPSTILVTPTWQKFEIRIANATDTVRRMVLRLRGTTGTSDYADVYVWGAKQEIGSTSTDYGHGKTLLAGDYLGVGSGVTQQVVMVVEDATSTGQGNITVKTEPPLRNAFTAGSVVTWDKPRALFRRKDSASQWDYEPGVTKGMSISLLEDPRP